MRRTRSLEHFATLKRAAYGLFCRTQTAAATEHARFHVASLEMPAARGQGGGAACRCELKVHPDCLKRLQRIAHGASAATSILQMYRTNAHNRATAACLNMNRCLERSVSADRTRACVASCNTPGRLGHNMKVVDVPLCSFLLLNLTSD